MMMFDGPTRIRRAELRRVVWSAVVWLVVVLAVLFWASPRAFGQTPSIYADSLGAGWENWSWGTTTGFTNPSPAQGSASIRVKHDGAWAGFYLHTGAAVQPSEFTAIRFWSHGGTAGGQRLRFSAYDTAGGVAGSVALPALTAGTWTQHSIALSSISSGSISGFVWQDDTGMVQPVYYLDTIELIAGPPPAAASLAIDVSADRRAISPLIYGMNFPDEGLAAELRLPIARWGGNAVTRYNYLYDTSNRASDWYFENIPNDNPQPGLLPTGSASDQFIEQNRRTGTQTLLTIPTIGWTPKSRDWSWGFSIAKYGSQTSTDPWRPDAGNGVRPGGALITGNDPHDTSVEIGPSFVSGWMSHLISRFGAAAAGGVRYYNLDNEPALWNSTHRDVRPQALGYDELLQRTIDYAAAIKATDPAAQTLGPAEWGWSNYFYSALDVAAGGSWWDTRPDRRAHGDVPLVDWYLQQLLARELSHGTRLLDYLDLHYYPQASGVTLGSAGSAGTKAMRLHSVRSLWDPTYTDESWIAEPVRLLPRMRDWVNTNYPGTKLAIGEYNWGGLEDVNGALAQADVLGVFGREGLDLATLWAPPAPGEPGAFAFRVFRNFDGSGGSFGETSVRATSTNQAQVAAYAAQRDDGSLTIIAINKTLAAVSCPITISGWTSSSPAQTWVYGRADPARIVTGPAVIVTPSGSLSLPAESITMVVLPAADCRADLNGDGLVDFTDYLAFLNLYEAQDPRADFNGDGLVDFADYLAFLNLYDAGC